MTKRGVRMLLNVTPRKPRKPKKEKNMPLYSYACPKCGRKEEFLLKHDAPAPKCPECKEPEMKKEISSAHFELKGSGWYSTDFKKK